MSKFSSRSPSKNLQIENISQSSNRESKNINISNRDSKNINSVRESKNVNISNLEPSNISISNRDSKNINISNRESKNINSIKIQQQRLNSIYSSNRESKNLNDSKNIKSKTKQNYFEIKKELKKELELENEKKLKKPNFIDNLYLKNKDEVNDFLENNKKTINLIGTKDISDIASSQAIETIKSNQKNWTDKIPGLKYINPEKNKDKEELSLTPLPEKKMGKYWKNELQKKEYDKAEREAKVMRKIEYTHAIIEGKREKKDPFQNIIKLRVNNKNIKTTKNGIKVFCVKNNPNVTEEDKERYYTVIIQKYFRKVRTIINILKRRSFYENMKKNNNNISFKNNEFENSKYDDLDIGKHGNDNENYENNNNNNFIDSFEDNNNENENEENLINNEQKLDKSNGLNNKEILNEPINNENLYSLKYNKKSLNNENNFYSERESKNIYERDLYSNTNRENNNFNNNQSLNSKNSIENSIKTNSIRYNSYQNRNNNFNKNIEENKNIEDINENNFLNKKKILLIIIILIIQEMKI